MEFISERLPDRVAPPLSQYARLAPIVVATKDDLIVFLSDRFFSGDESVFLDKPISSLVAVEPSVLSPPAPQDVQLVIDTGGIQLESVTFNIGEGVKVHMVAPKGMFDTKPGKPVYQPAEINAYAMYYFVNFTVATIDQLKEDVGDLKDAGMSRIAALEKQVAELVSHCGADDTGTEEDENQIKVSSHKIDRSKLGL